MLLMGFYEIAPFSACLMFIFEFDLPQNIQMSVLTKEKKEDCFDGLDHRVMKCSIVKGVVFPSAAPLHLSRFAYILMISEV